MNARKKTRTNPRVSVEPPLRAPRQNAKVCADAAAVLDNCLLVISLVELVGRSLEAQEIASSEQEVLKLALKEQWLVHDWLSDLTPVIRPRKADGGGSSPSPTETT